MLVVALTLAAAVEATATLAAPAAMVVAAAAEAVAGMAVTMVIASAVAKFTFFLNLLKKSSHILPTDCAC